MGKSVGRRVLPEYATSTCALAEARFKLGKDQGATMRVYITGIKGQLGRALARQWAPSAEVSGCDLPEVSITDPAAITAAITTARPDIVVHCAAITDVDGCARDPDMAHWVNGMGTQNVAIACQETGAEMVYISTNEVFSGKGERAYREFDPPDPVNPYGRTKAVAEWYVSHLLTRFYIVRTVWLYAAGGRNFIHAIQNAADKHGALRVVTDEVGNPTYVEDLAAAIIQLAETGRYGIYHLVNTGACSRYIFAAKILELTGREQVPITPIIQAQWPRASTPPAFAPLENTCAAALGIHLRPWEEALTEYLARNAQDLP
jgi:dTDP-4-dehydrorhamnose reductase